MRGVGRNSAGRYNSQAAWIGCPLAGFEGSGVWQELETPRRDDSMPAKRAG